jgi:hypothetical protein
LLGINQVKYKCKKHKHYNYLQIILKQEFFTKVIKNAKLENLSEEYCWSNLKGEDAQAH